MYADFGLVPNIQLYPSALPIVPCWREFGAGTKHEEPAVRAPLLRAAVDFPWNIELVDHDAVTF